MRKEPMSPAKIKEHEPNAVRRDASDQNIADTESANHDEACERARSGMTKGTAGAAETGDEYEQGAEGTNR